MSPTDQIALVAVDVDGTLLTSDQQISPRTRAALRRTLECGVTVLPVTSRGAIALHSVMRRFDFFRSATFVAAQGALLGSYGTDQRLRIVERHPAALEPARHLVRRAAAHGLTTHWFAGNHWYVSSWDDTVEAETRCVGATPVIEDLGTLRLAPDKLMLIAPTNRKRSLDVVRTIVPTGLQASFSHERFLEITRCGVDKGWAVARYCWARGIDPAQVLAIGDGPNDLPLFSFAGVSAAPANAHPDVRSAATVVTADNDHDGVADAVEMFIA